MWRAVNVSEVPIKITQFGKDVIVPYDGRIITFEDDNVYEEYKTLFHIIEEPPKKPFVDKVVADEIKGLVRPLTGLKVNLDKVKKRYDKYNLKNKYKENARANERGDGRGHKKYTWIFISPEGDVYNNPPIMDMARLIDCDYHLFYKFAKKEKPLYGWRITRELINKEQEEK